MFLFTQSVIDELRELYPEVLPEKVQTLTDALSRINAVLKKKFIVIVDEWDVLIRDESANQKVQEEYINFLRGIFKGNVPKRYISLAYLTGILPIKKLRTQSALNNFDEFTMLDAGDLAPYIGFTEDEVEVDISSFQNDMVSFSNKDDVLTCLIHLGYLGYNQNSKMAFVPNEEIRQELTNAVRRK